MTGDFVEYLSDQVSGPHSRRGFLSTVGKVIVGAAVAVTGAATILTGSAEAAIYCCFPNTPCPNPPNCPSGGVAVPAGTCCLGGSSGTNIQCYNCLVGGQGGAYQCSFGIPSGGCQSSPAR